VSQASLWDKEGEDALAYLKSKRHLSDEIIKRFQFGYCPRDVNHDLAGRIIMPCFDAHGNLVALSTRDYEAEKKWQHWHESFDKSSYLFGLNFAKKAIRWSDRAIVVEGQFDVTCLHSHRLPMTVGLFGTTLSIMHIALLSRYCSEIYMVLDPNVTKSDGTVNRSGEEATIRAMQLHSQYCLGTYGIHFIPVTLPNELDPDDFVFQQGTQAMIKILDKRRQEVLYG